MKTLAAILLLIAPAWGQITLAPEHALGKRIVATTSGEAKAYAWHSDTADLLTEGGSCFIWARPGKHTLTLIAVSEDYTIRRWTAEFTVSDSPAPPTPATLRELVSDTDAATIAEYLRALAGQVASIKDAEHFWSVWSQTFPVRGNAKLDAALKARLTPAIEKKTGLSVELRALADEFAADEPTPPTPPVVQGKREVIIVHESADRSPAFGALVTSLRKPGGNADAYLATNGHTLTILDDELLRESKWHASLGDELGTLPKLFVIDPQTNAILFESVIANGTTADNIVERIRETGG